MLIYIKFLLDKNYDGLKDLFLWFTKINIEHKINFIKQNIIENIKYKSNNIYFDKIINFIDNKCFILRDVWKLNNNILDVKYVYELNLFDNQIIHILFDNLNNLITLNNNDKFNDLIISFINVYFNHNFVNYKSTNINLLKTDYIIKCNSFFAIDSY